MFALKKSLLVSLVAASLFNSVLAAENWDLCQIPTFAYFAPSGLANKQTSVEAKTIASDDSEQVSFEGDVKIIRAQQSIQADRASMIKKTQYLKAQGNVLLESPDYRLKSPSIEIDAQNNTAIFDKPEFELRQRHASGHAKQIKQIDASRIQFRDLYYTACDPQSPDWHLTAEKMEIDDESGRGSATHTWLYFKGVPFLYLPYFQFPIDNRRLSGLLTPSFGHTASSGNSFALPFYWNIAPNYDITSTIAHYSDAGTQLNVENRYLFIGHKGQIDSSYLADKRYRGAPGGGARWFNRWNHQAQLGLGIQAEMSLVQVSDKTFFDDFPRVVAEYNDTKHLKRFGRIWHQGEHWSSELLWQNYQTLDEATVASDRPYSRRPSLSLSGNFDWHESGLELSLFNQWVDFVRDDSVTGSRGHSLSTVSWLSSASWYRFKPEVQVALSEYHLNNNIISSVAHNDISRNLSSFSLDTSLVFDRLMGADNQWLHTLEPRLFLLYTPFQDQSTIPDFDTALLSHNYAALFSQNRFSGVDRIGDAKQLSLGLETKISHADSGSELLAARIGQTYFFEDRRVSLNGDIDTNRRSDTIAELDLWPSPNLKLSTRLKYDQSAAKINDSDFSINYAKQGFAANFEYYSKDDELEQAIVSMVYPINPSWSLIAKAQYSLLFDEPVENLFGLNYESCCWGLKILAAQRGDEADNFSKTEDSIYFEITLKGLSQLGTDIDSQLRDAITGYQPGF